MKKQLSKSDIMLDTVWYYNEDPKRRCPGKFNGGDIGHHCAVGRFFHDDFKAMGKKMPRNDASFAGLIWPDNQHHDEYLKEEARGHDLEFWTDLLKWHDDDLNFDELGLNTRGWEKAHEMAEKWLVNAEIKDRELQEV